MMAANIVWYESVIFVQKWDNLIAKKNWYDDRMRPMI